MDDVEFNAIDSTNLLKYLHTTIHLEKKTTGDWIRHVGWLQFWSMS